MMFRRDETKTDGIRNPTPLKRTTESTLRPSTDTFFSAGHVWCCFQFWLFLLISFFIAIKGGKKRLEITTKSISEAAAFVPVFELFRVTSAASVTCVIMAIRRREGAALAIGSSSVWQSLVYLSNWMFRINDCVVVFESPRYISLGCRCMFCCRSHGRTVIE